MKRVLAIAILVVLGFGTVSPLFALGGFSDPSLPACCRRDGRHHCMAMPGAASEPGLPNTPASMATLTGRLTEQCPFGTHAVPATGLTHLALDTSAAIFAGILSHPSVAPQTESKRRISADRSRQKRGPPTPSVA